VYDAVIRALQLKNLEAQTMGRLLKSTLKIMHSPSQANPDLKLRPLFELRSSISGILGQEEYKEISGEFMAGFTDRK